MSNIKLFESKQIRSIWNESDNKLYFSVADVVETLTDTTKCQGIHQKDAQARAGAERQLGDNLSPLELLAPDGNESVTACNALRMTAYLSV